MRVFLAALWLVLCVASPVSAQITISPTSTTLSVNATQQFTTSATGNPAPQWTSSNPTVASVSQTGLVKALAPGSTTIQVKQKKARATAAVTVTGNPPPPPPPTGTCPVGAVIINPGQNANTIAAGYPARTAFCFNTGTHHQQSVQPREGDTWAGAAGAILSGDNVTADAFQATANYVTITGLIIENYANAAQHGAIHGDNTVGWIITGNEVRYTSGTGIRVGNIATVKQNNVHHNGQLGVGMGGLNVADTLIEDNEVAYNNTAGYDPGWEAGGLKLTNTIRLTVRANWVHHNAGPGIWTDINNINTLIENNTVEDNDRIGIFHEISYAAVIRNNSVKRNGFGFSVWAWGGGIVIAASPNVEVYGNLLDGNADNIIAIQQNRQDAPSSYGPHEISNLYVHDNQSIVTSGWTGFVQDVGDTSYFTSRNNRFLANTYTLTGAPALPFTWNNQELTLAQWQAYGLQ